MKRNSAGRRRNTSKYPDVLLHQQRNNPTKHGWCPMVNSSTHAMVATLAGLRRIEAQIHRAMMEAGGSSGQPETLQKTQEVRAMDAANQQMARANSVLNNVDLMA